LSRGGGISPFMQNVRLCFFLPQRSCRRRTDPVGWYESVPMRLSKIVRRGNFRLDTFAGLLTGRSVRGRSKEAGKRRWKYADNARCSEPCCHRQGKGCGSKYLSFLFALPLTNSSPQSHSLIVDYYLKGCIEGQKLKIALRRGRSLWASSCGKGGFTFNSFLIFSRARMKKIWGSE